MVAKHYYDRKGYFTHKNCDRSTERIFLNSGFMMGRKRDFISLFKTVFSQVTLGEPKPRIEDQALYQYVHATQKYPILMDCESILVYSPFSVCRNVVPGDNEWGCSISEFPDKRPFAIHSNGGLCDSTCGCLRNIQRSGKLKKNIEKLGSSDFSINSYNVGTKMVKPYTVMSFCGRYLNEEYPLRACNK